jgi:hypothetical protein
MIQCHLIFVVSYKNIAIAQKSPPTMKIPIPEL